MTQYELVDAFLSHIAMAVTFLTAFLSATSAFLITVYLAGAKIPTLLSRLMLGIYVIAALFFVTNYNRIWSIAADIRTLMTGDVPWHTSVKEPQWLFPSVGYLGLFVMGAMFIGSVAYYRRVRDEIKTASNIRSEEQHAPFSAAPPNKGMNSDA